MYISRNLEQWNAFLATLQTAFEQGKAQDFLTLLLTPDERDAVGLRLQIVAQLLEKNLSQREIQQNLNTSAATITRGSNMLKTMDPDFINWVKSQLDEQARGCFLERCCVAKCLPSTSNYLLIVHLNSGKPSTPRS